MFREVRFIFIMMWFSLPQVWLLGVARVGHPTVTRAAATAPRLIRLSAPQSLRDTRPSMCRAVRRSAFSSLVACVIYASHALQDHTRCLILLLKTTP